MTTDDAPSLEPWLSALRADAEPIPAGSRERLAARLGVAPVLAAGVVASLSGGARRSWLYSHGLAVAIAVPVGAAIGVAAHAYGPRPTSALVAPAKPRVAPTLPATPEVAALPSVAPSPPLAELAQSSPKAAALPKSSSKPEGEAPSLERELSLLERARARLSEGQPQATLNLLSQHEAAYPASALKQESEALAIRALAAAGRLAEARRRADAFVRAYPTSALRGSVERAVETIP